MVDNYAAFPVTGRGFWRLCTRYPHTYPLVAAKQEFCVDNRGERCGVPVDKLGITFFGNPARLAAKSACG